MKQRMDARGVTTDGRGHLFVADFQKGNSSIQMFSVDGQYLGCLMKDVETHGFPCRIHWCKKTASLLGAFFFKGKLHLKVISVQF